MKVHNLAIRNKAPGTMLTGMKTEVLLDGKPLQGLQSIHFEVIADGVAKVTLKMLADFKLEETAVEVEESK